MDFELSVRARDQCVVVRIDGECDAGRTAALRESLLGVLAANPARVVLDLSGLDFLDCAGARVLVAVGRRATLLGGTLAVAALTDPVARLLQVTGLGARLAVFPAADAALAAVRPAGGSGNCCPAALSGAARPGTFLPRPGTG